MSQIVVAVPVRGRAYIAAEGIRHPEGCRRSLARITGLRWTHDPASGRFLVTRSRTPELIRSLLDWFTEVVVVRGGRSSQRCDLRCVEASGFDCVCSCAYLNHGFGAAPPGYFQVGESTLVKRGEFVVSSTTYRRKGGAKKRPA